MTRYSWPHATDLLDEGFARRGFGSVLFPPPDFALPDGSFPPVGDPPPDPPPTADALWLPLGPSVVLGGQASGDPRVAGRVRDLAVEPTEGRRLYAATGSGGVWYSDSRGVSWEPLDAFAASPNRNTQTPVGNSLSCGAIHVEWGAADDGSQDVVTVGTGEIYGTTSGGPGGKLSGVGILRATGPATGSTWSREAVGAAGDIDLRGRGFYRIVSDPSDSSVVLAATTFGLIARNADGTWRRTTFISRALDVAFTRHADRVRVWVAGASVLSVDESTTPPASPTIDPAGLSFRAVTLPNVLNRVVASTGRTHRTRLALAVGADQDDLWVLGRRDPPGTGSFEPAHCWHVDASLDLTTGTPSATEVSGLPPELFGGNDQSDYDMAIAAHTSVDDRLWVGGSTVLIDGVWNASLYQLAVARSTSGGVTTFTATPTLVGRGIHADVHSIRIAPSPSTGGEVSVWVGCDGGVFLSDRDGDPNSYFSRNTGLATLEPGFVASHPTNDGIVAAGMQDNGVCVRSGDTVWVEPFRGDGGGLVFDPSHPNRFINQYTRATWRFSGSNSTPPVHRRRLTTGNNSQKLESDESAFYSGADAMDHGGTVHLALGTNRVWYSADWGRHWVTLPTGTDPRRNLAVDLAQDVLFGSGAGTAFTDTERSFLCCTSSEAGSSAPGSSILAVKWGARTAAGGRDRIRLAALVNDANNSGLALIEGSRPTGASGAWTWETPARLIAIRAVNSGVAAEQTAVDAGDPTAFLPAPGRVNDVAVHDPDRGADGSYYITTVGHAGTGAGREIDTLWWYDGSGNFLPVGLRRVHARGTWNPANHRITAPAHAVLVDPADRTVVFVGTSVGVVRGTFSDGPPSWAWERFDNNLPEAVVHDLSIHDHDGVRLLRAALAARGIWEVDLTGPASPRDYLRLHATDTRRRLPTPIDGPTTNGVAGTVRWDASPDVVIDQTSFTYPGGPLEPTIVETLRPPRVGRRTSAVVETTTLRVHVLVHHRWHEPAQPADLRVALLRHVLADDGTAPLDGLWAALVSISAGGDPPDPLPGNWTAAGDSLIESIAHAATSRTPRAASFDVDLSGVSGTDVVLLAVVLSDGDPLTAAEISDGGSDATTVEDLVVRSRHAAARTIRAD